jgi:hypothetical protein
VQWSSYLTNFDKTWVFWRNIRDTSATPSGIKREWYVCIFYFMRHRLVHTKSMSSALHLSGNALYYSCFYIRVNNEKYRSTLRTSPRCTKSTGMLRSLRMFSSSSMVTRTASVAFRESSLESASDVLP